MNILNDVVLAIKKRYSTLHPLLVSRSIERAKDEYELFDILDSVPDELPLVWCQERRRWVVCDLISLPENYCCVEKRSSYLEGDS